eukprot:2087544-Lingulodinium_polyedra.AAC.1
MFHFKRQTGEGMDNFMHRTEAVISHLMMTHGVLPFDSLAHRAVFRWAGHLVQIRQAAPERLTSVVFARKDWAYIRQLGAAKDGRQLHGRMLPAWRWARP